VSKMVCPLRAEHGVGQALVEEWSAAPPFATDVAFGNSVQIDRTSLSDTITLLDLDGPIIDTGQHLCGIARHDDVKDGGPA
jgi:hypothetical protein